MNFGETLIFLRNKKNKTRKEAAQEMGILYSTLSNYETNQRQPDFDTLIQISKYYNKSIDFLLGVVKEEPSEHKIIAAHATKDLTEEEQNKLIEYAKFLKSQRE